MNAWRTLLPNALLIAAREYASRIRTRTFVVSTVILGAIAFAAALSPIILSSFVGSQQIKVGVYAAASGVPSDYLSVLDAATNGSAAGGSGHRQFLFQTAPDVAAADAAMKAGTLNALIVIDRDATTNDLAFTLRADVPSDSIQVSLAKNACNYLAIEDRLGRAGVPMSAVQTPAKFVLESTKGAVGSGGQPRNTTDETSKYLISTGLIVLIFMAIITYGTWVATSVAEEKGSRVMELMLNAATPLQMLTGKVVGNGGAGLTQYAAILLAAGAGILAQPLLAERLDVETGTTFSGLTPQLFVGFLGLFVLGFMLYALLYAGLGSLVSRQEDVQSATAPLMAMIMIGYFLSVFAINAIDEAWVVALSFVPFFSPYLMLARLAVGHVAPWELAAVVVIMLVCCAVALWIAARIYSAGVLLYGQRVGLRQVLSAARVAR